MRQARKGYRHVLQLLELSCKWQACDFQPPNGVALHVLGQVQPRGLNVGGEDHVDTFILKEDIFHELCGLSLRIPVCFVGALQQQLVQLID